MDLVSSIYYFCAMTYNAFIDYTFRGTLQELADIFRRRREEGRQFNSVEIKKAKNLFFRDVDTLRGVVENLTWDGVEKEVFS